MAQGRAPWYGIRMKTPSLLADRQRLGVAQEAHLRLNDVERVLGFLVQERHQDDHVGQFQDCRDDVCMWAKGNAAPTSITVLPVNGRADAVMSAWIAEQKETK